MRSFTCSSPPSARHAPHPELLRPTGSTGLSLDNLGVQLVHDAQVVWRANPIYLQRLQQHQDVLDAGQVDAPLSSELLNDLQLAHVALGVAPPVGRRPVGFDEAQVLVHHQGAGMGFQDFGRDADGIEGLIEVEPGEHGDATLGSGHASVLDPVLHAAAEAGRRRLRLDQVIEGAQFEAAVDQFLLAIVGEDDDRNVPGHGVLAEVFEHGEAVHLGQPDIQEDDVRDQLLGLFQALLARLGNGYPVAVELQLELVHLGHSRVVLDKEDIDLLVDDFTHGRSFLLYNISITFPALAPGKVYS